MYRGAKILHLLPLLSLLSLFKGVCPRHWSTLDSHNLGVDLPPGKREPVILQLMAPSGE